MDMRKSFDMTPWNSDGHSAFGLKRTQAKYFALVFIVLGFLFLSPPFDAIPNDFLNFFLAGWILKLLPSVSYNLALLSTYIIVGPALILLGAWIYPHNTHSLLNGYINKAKSALKKAVKKPISIIVGIILFIIMYNLYKGWLL